MEYVNRLVQLIAKVVSCFSQHLGRAPEPVNLKAVQRETESHYEAIPYQLKGRVGQQAPYIADADQYRIEGKNNGRNHICVELALNLVAQSVAHKVHRSKVTFFFLKMLGQLRHVVGGGPILADRTPNDKQQEKLLSANQSLLQVLPERFLIFVSHQDPKHEILH